MPTYPSMILGGHLTLLHNMLQQTRAQLLRAYHNNIIAPQQLSFLER